MFSLPRLRTPRPRVSCSTTLAIITLITPVLAGAEVTPRETGAFLITQAVELPGTPEEIFDATTGDISGWWDHHFSEKPLRFFIEPRPGGGFFEIFDEAGNGVRHATVLVADRGKLLRLEGPLGLSGHALLMVHTLEYEAVGENRTRLKVSVRGSGEMEAGWAEAVDGVWWHFLHEGLKPYVEAGKHLER